MSKNIKKEVIEGIQKALNKAIQNEQQKPNQFVVAYYNKNNDSLFGYHLSTTCQLTDNILEAKRYNGDNPYEQIAVITNNLKGVFSTPDECPEEYKGNLGELFWTLKNDTKNRYYKNIKFEDIYLDAIYLSDGMEPQQFNFIEIT